VDEKPHDFWNIDLGRLTWSGWLLMLLTIGTVLGVAILVVFLLELLGFERDPSNPRGDRWMMVLGMGGGVGAASGVFLLGRRLFDRLGCPILRPEKRKPGRPEPP
jgi:hypothetical protein